MQSLTAPPRDSLTAAQVTALLTGANVQVTGGLELLAPDLTVVEDISDDLADGSVSRNCDARIHGTCRLRISRELTWGIDLVRPYLTLTAGGVSARFNLGVFCLTTPERQYAESPATYDVDGFDRLYYLDRLVGDTYSVAAGTDVLTAIRQVFTDAGLSGVLLAGDASGDTVPTDMVWPITDQQPATWLNVVNDLLSLVNYRAVWADENGTYRGDPYQDPATRGVEWVLDEGEFTTVQGEDRSLMADKWRAPNKWIFRQSNRDPAAAAPSVGDGIYVVDESASDPRGLVWPSVVDYDVSSQAALVSLGDRKVAADKRMQSTWSLKDLGPLPTVGHFDLLTLVVDGVAYRVQGNEWSMSLTSGLVDYTVLEGVS